VTVMPEGEELIAFAKTYKIKIVSIDEIRNYLLARK